MIKFVEVVNETNFNPRLERTAIPKFSLGELWINQNNVIKIREAAGYRQLLVDGRLGTDLDQNHSFTSITINNCGMMETHIVVGPVSEVAAKLNQDTRTLLRG